MPGPASPTPGTHQVDDGDAEQTANGQDGQGQPQQGLGLHPLGDGLQCPSGGAAPLWRHGVRWPAPAPGQGAHGAAPRRMRKLPRAPLVTVSRCAVPVPSPELSTHRVHRQKGRSHPSGRGRPQPLGGHQQPGRADYWEKHPANCHPGRRGEVEHGGLRGRVEAAGGPVGQGPARCPLGPSHSPGTRGQSTGLAPAPAHRPPARRTHPGPPSWRGENLSPGGPSAQGQATGRPPTPQHPNSPAPGHFLPLPDYCLHAAKGIFENCGPAAHSRHAGPVVTQTLDSCPAPKCHINVLPIWSLLGTY